MDKNIDGHYINKDSRGNYILVQSYKFYCLRFVFALFVFVVCMIIYATVAKKIIIENTFLNEIIIGCFIIPSLALFFWSIGGFDFYKIYIKQEDLFKFVPYKFTSYDLFLKQVEKGSNLLEYNYKRTLYTEDKKETFNLYTKIDTEKTFDFPKEKVAIYRAKKFYAVTHLNDCVGNSRIDIRDTYAKDIFLPLFSKDKISIYPNIKAITSVDTILLVVVDEMDSSLSTILSAHHMSNILFCVINLDEMDRIYIGNDLRRVQDSSYQNKIKELLQILEIYEIDEYDINQMFKSNKVWYKGKYVGEKN